MSHKVGILGGTFDPIHKGHIAIAKLAAEECELEQVILIPTGTPPHKETQVTSAEHRYRMTELAADEIPFLIVSDIESKRTGYSYTVDTINQLKKEQPDTEYFYIIGADNIGYIRQWKDAKALLKGLNIICISREGYDMEPEGQILEREFGAMVHNVHIKAIPISSTEIREKLNKKEDVKQYLNEAVLTYIQKNKLYGE